MGCILGLRNLVGRRIGSFIAILLSWGLFLLVIRFLSLLVRLRVRSSFLCTAAFFIRFVFVTGILNLGRFGPLLSNLRLIFRNLISSFMRWLY